MHYPSRFTKYTFDENIHTLFPKYSQTDIIKSEKTISLNSDITRKESIYLYKYFEKKLDANHYENSLPDIKQAIHVATNVMGQREGLSKTDSRMIQKMYKCYSKCHQTISVRHEDDELKSITLPAHYLEFRQEKVEFYIKVLNDLEGKLSNAEKVDKSQKNDEPLLNSKRKDKTGNFNSTIRKSPTFFLPNNKLNFNATKITISNYTSILRQVKLNKNLIHKFSTDRRVSPIENDHKGQYRSRRRKANIEHVQLVTKMFDKIDELMQVLIKHINKHESNNYKGSFVRKRRSHPIEPFKSHNIRSMKCSWILKSASSETVLVELNGIGLNLVKEMKLPQTSYKLHKIMKDDYVTNLICKQFMRIIDGPYESYTTIYLFCLLSKDHDEIRRAKIIPSRSPIVVIEMVWRPEVGILTKIVERVHLMLNEVVEYPIVPWLEQPFGDIIPNHSKDILSKHYSNRYSFLPIFNKSSEDKSNLKRKLSQHKTGKLLEYFYELNKTIEEILDFRNDHLSIRYRAQCGGIINLDERLNDKKKFMLIQSPNFPYKSKNRLHCRWKIFTKKKFHNPAIRVRSMILEDRHVDTMKCFDYIRLYNNHEDLNVDTLLAEWCGSILHNETKNELIGVDKRQIKRDYYDYDDERHRTYSSTNYLNNKYTKISDTTSMLIEYQTDNETSSTGFVLEVFIDANECIIYNGKNGSNQLCGGRNHRCVNLLNDYTCNCDEYSRLFMMKVNGRIIYECRSECGGIIDLRHLNENETVELRTKNYPISYPNLQQCLWDIIPKENYSILINFTQIDLPKYNERTKNCRDFLQIYKLQKNNNICFNKILSDDMEKMIMKNVLTKLGLRGKMKDDDSKNLMRMLRNEMTLIRNELLKNYTSKLDPLLNMEKYHQFRYNNRKISMNNYCYFEELCTGKQTRPFQNEKTIYWEDNVIENRLTYQMRSDESLRLIFESDDLSDATNGINAIIQQS
ncbi:hypothetical protein SNEBB_010125 [Seison nebaliae]|nr:hypothetical protein SNEBB_010125 [Seison nebaliae]